ncbi:MAG TPA: TIM barrel protein [Vicinamibacterales bacterium]|nr:TIM barrel protein [Vicinamibacterales bacterium]HOQ60500.1 TIM barrel protein [Vicinamibacterales bacterium]
MKRRDFIARGLASAAALAAAPLPALARQQAGPLAPPGPPKPKFRLRYAPSFGQFTSHAGAGLAAQVEFASNEGFTAMFDNGLMSRPLADQETIVRELEKRGMTLGPFVLLADFKNRNFVLRDKDVRAALLQKMRDGVETMKRTGARTALVVPGRYDESLAWEYQTANLVDNLRACMDVCAPAGLTIVLEPLNPRDHPGLFLSKIPQAYQICRAVASPHCKIVNDIYHQQISEGNILPNIEAAWDEIAAFHVGDNPGRKEPTSGEINFRNVFKYLHGRGYQGPICMEHGQSKPGLEGERAVIDAYRSCDAF